MIRSTAELCEVQATATTTIEKLIVNICDKAKLDVTPDHYYLTLDSHQLSVTDTLQTSGLLKAVNSSNPISVELRLKFVHKLNKSIEIGTHVVLVSPEQLNYKEVLQIPTAPTKEQIMPQILQSVAKQTIEHTSHSSTFSSSLISMPVFAKKALDELPSMNISVPIKPNEFDWNEFLESLAADLGIDKNDMFIISAVVGSTKYEIKFKAAISRSSKKMEKIAKKLKMILLPNSKTSQFIEHKKSGGDNLETSTFEASLSNLHEKETSFDNTSLSSDDIDTALTMMQRPAIIDGPAWEYLSDKSREITASIMHAFQLSDIEFVIENMSLIHNDQLYQRHHECNVHGEEQVLFHGTRTVNFDPIFENNFKFLGTTDNGWYGQGIYFSSSPNYCIFYSKWDRKSILYLICSIVKLGKQLTVIELGPYTGKPLHADYDSHYVKVNEGGSPTDATEGFFEEFVIKNSDQVLPLYIVGLRRVYRFVLWRDAKITNSHNSAIFAQMKEKYSFNIYSSETSIEALNILKCKLKPPKHPEDSENQCIVVTNGADDGEQFVTQCRSIQSSVPVIVYCMNLAYHQQWAQNIHGEPSVRVTTDSAEVFNFIASIFT